MNQKMKLHWSPKSPYVRKVMICANELGLSDQIELIRSVAAMTKPNQLIMVDNPLSKIPTLVTTDGQSLFDSIVICEYLNQIKSGPLFPSDQDRKWAVLRWQALGDGMMDTAILWRNERDERAEPSSVLLESFQIRILACLQMLEAEVDSIQSSPFSIAHISLGCALGYLDYRFQNLNWRVYAPKLALFFETLASRPSFKKTEPADG